MADEVDLHWTAEVSFIGPVDRHKELAVQRLREVATYIEKIPNEVFIALIERTSQGQSTGGVCGGPFRGSDITSGWRGIWRVMEQSE
jgi:hypothetical protein